MAMFRIEWKDRTDPDAPQYWHDYANQVTEEYALDFMRLYGASPTYEFRAVPVAVPTYTPLADRCEAHRQAHGAHVHGPQCNHGAEPTAPAVEPQEPASVDAGEAEEDVDTVRCDDCGDTVPADDARIDGSSTICDECIDAYSYCSSCEELTLIEDMHQDTRYRYRDRLYCEPCFNDRFSDCDSCGTAVHNDYTLSDENGEGTYCEPCYSEQYTRCDSCDRVISREDASEYGRCERCARPRVVNSYRTNVLHTHTFAGKPADGVYYGIELEVECANTDSGSAYHDAAKSVHDALEEHCILKEDGSLDHGFEIVTRPASLDVHREQFNRFFDLKPASTYGIRSHNTTTCGLHIHVSRKNLSELQIGKMQCFLHNPDNAKFIETVAQRSSDSYYCKFNTRKKLTDARKGNPSRYTALNLENYNTVELRIFKGTLNRRSFFKCLEFTHALVCYTRSSVTSCADAVDHRKFIAWIQEPTRAKEYRNLIEFLYAHNVAGVKPVRSVPAKYRQFTLSPEESSACA